MIKGGEHDLCCLRRCIVSVSLSCECDAALHDTDDTWAVHKNPPHMYVDDFYGSFIDRYFFDNDIFMYSLLYATSYFFMTYFLTKHVPYPIPMWKMILVVLAGCIWLAGMLQLFYIADGTAFRTPGFYLTCIASVLVCRIARRIYDRKQMQAHAYAVELVFPARTLSANAFVDTGNRLQNPYTKQPAILINYPLLKNLLSEQSYAQLEQYHKTGQFPYLQMNETGEITFFPIPYHTIGNRFSLMPAITIPKLVYTQSRITFYAVTAGISREIFFENRYDVLLHEKLQPKKEEPT